MYPAFVLDPEAHLPPPDVDVVIFPEFVEGDIGVYRADQVSLKKRLAELGIRAEYAYPPDKRAWLRELSAGEILLSIAIGLGTGGAVALVQHFLTRNDTSSRVRVKLVRARKVRGRRVWDAEWIELEGSSEDVAAALDRWRDDDDGGR